MSRFLAVAAAHLVAMAAAETYPNISDMNKYLLIGTGSNQNHKSVNVQNGDLGADIVVLSTEINDNVDFDLVSRRTGVAFCYICHKQISTITCLTPARRLHEQRWEDVAKCR